MYRCIYIIYIYRCIYIYICIYCKYDTCIYRQVEMQPANRA